MTARYRCAWCGSFSTAHAKDLRDHVLTRHRMQLEALLMPLRTFNEVLPSEEV